MWQRKQGSLKPFLRHNVLPSRCTSSKQTSRQPFAWKQAPEYLSQAAENSRNMLHAMGGRQWGQGRKLTTVPSLQKGCSYLGQGRNKYSWGGPQSAAGVGQLERIERELPYTHKNLRPTGLQNEPGDLCLPVQTRDDKGAHLVQETKIKFPPSMQAAGGCQAASWPAAGTQALSPEGDFGRHNPFPTIINNLAKESPFEIMKWLLLLLYVKKTFTDLSEGEADAPNNMFCPRSDQKAEGLRKKCVGWRSGLIEKPDWCLVEELTRQNGRVWPGIPKKMVQLCALGPRMYRWIEWGREQFCGLKLDYFILYS